MPTRFALAAAVLATAALPAAASATTTVSTGYDFLDVQRLVVRGDDDASALTVGLVKNRERDYTFTVADPSRPVAAGQGCAAADAHTVTCPGIDPFLVMRLGGGDDRVSIPATTEWQTMDIQGGKGDDRVDASLIKAHGDVDGSGVALDFDAGEGDDELAGGPSTEGFYGAEGADVAHGAGGADNFAGGDGRDRLYGEAGADLLAGEAGDVVDGGDGDDQFYGDDDEPECGAGRDTISVAYSVAPGPIVAPDCERMDLGVGSQPVAVGRDSLTFEARSADPGYGRATAIMRLLVRGRQVATRRFTTAGRTRVRLRVPARVLARRTLVQVRIEKYRVDREGIGQFFRDNYNWRVRVGG